MGARIHPNPCKPLRDRLWARVDKSKPNSCWPWTGAKTKQGYGCIGKGGKHGGTVLAHRAAFEDAKGPVPEGLHVLHTCDNPPCCNPAHLWAGNNADNVADCITKGRKRWRASQGEAHGSAKLTDTKVRAIRKAKGSQREIAAKFKISQAIICDIRNGKLWTHVK